jgi:hypothetical protein
MVPLFLVGLLLLAAPANATVIEGYGKSFSYVSLGCPGPPQYSAPVVGTHVDAMVRVTFDDLPDANGMWSIDLGEDPFIWNAVEFAGSDGTTWWWPQGTVRDGWQLSTHPECSSGDLPFTGHAEFFDRPHTPFTFSDPAIRPGGSILGFVASQAGDYVADVTVRQGSLSLTNPDYEYGDDAVNGPGAWQMTIEAPYTFPDSAFVTKTVELGRLTQGLHDIPLGFSHATINRDGDFSIRVRLRDDPPAVPAPVAGTPPPVQETTATALSVATTATSPAPPAPAPPAPSVTTADSTTPAVKAVTLASARSAARRVLRSRFRGWSVAKLACLPTGAGPVRCSFTVRRQGRTARGQVTMSRMPHYRLSATVPRAGCHPARARRCSSSLTVSR